MQLVSAAAGELGSGCSSPLSLTLREVPITRTHLSRRICALSLSQPWRLSLCVHSNFANSNWKGLRWRTLIGLQTKTTSPFSAFFHPPPPAQKTGV